MGNSPKSEMANKYGQIYMNTESKNYFQGEIVKGNIFVNIIQPYPGKVLYLSIEGHEFCQWARRIREKDKIKGRVEKKKKCGPRGYRDIYSHKIAIHSFGDQRIPQGQWNFPFYFELDKDMPATFKYNTPKIDSSIVYRMKAIIESADLKAVKNMEHSQELSIFQIQDENYAPLSKNQSLEATLFWVFSRGNTQINAFLNKNNYVIGEEVVLTCEIDNKQCKSQITDLEIEFERKLELTSRCGKHKKKTFRLLTRRNVLAIPENYKEIVVTEFRFKVGNEKRQKLKNVNMIPNTSIGKLVKNHYFLKIVIHYGGFLAAKCQKIALPIMVYEKGYHEKFNPVVVEPPVDWNPQVMPLRNVSMIDAQFVAPIEERKEDAIAGYEYPVMNQENLWSDEKYQMMGDYKK